MAGSKVTGETGKVAGESLELQDGPETDSSSLAFRQREGMEVSVRNNAPKSCCPFPSLCVWCPPSAPPPASFSDVR